MSNEKFDLLDFAGFKYWFVKDADKVLLFRGPSNNPRQEMAGRIEANRVRDLSQWLNTEDRLTATFDGPMANEIKKAAGELGIPETMVIQNAVKLFLDIGSSKG
ncbi:MAG: hypothetical protein FJ319_08860 [SAR202 cluster bacterium]|nr:hypothetical protein [SAR202 cluster bacterium]